MGFHLQRTMWLWRNSDNVTHRQLLSIDQVWRRSTALTWSRWGCRRLADNIWLLAHANNNIDSVLYCTQLSACLLCRCCIASSWLTWLADTAAVIQLDDVITSPSSGDGKDSTAQQVRLNDTDAYRVLTGNNSSSSHRMTWSTCIIICSSRGVPASATKYIFTGQFTGLHCSLYEVPDPYMISKNVWRESRF